MIDVNGARNLKVGTCVQFSISTWGTATPFPTIDGVVVCVIGADEGLGNQLAHYYMGEHESGDPTMAKYGCLPYTRLVVLGFTTGAHYLVHCTEEWFDSVGMNLQLMSVTKPELNVYTCNDFEGHYPVGVAAIIIAPDEKDAEGLFGMALDSAGLSRANAEVKHTLVKIDKTKADAIILNDGNY